MGDERLSSLARLNIEFLDLVKAKSRKNVSISIL